MNEFDTHEPKHSSSETKSGETTESFLKGLLVDIIVALVLAAICLYFVRPSIVRQSSMENTLHENDYMIMSRQAYRNDDPQRGDIIIFESSLVNEDGDYKLLIKRVIGLPGDELMIRDDQLYINGEEYVEDYLKDGITPPGDALMDGETYTVPEGCYFAMGDNRVYSEDSRSSLIGCVARGDIKGKVVLRLFPFNKIQRF